MADARFEDGEEGPLKLIALGEADLSVFSALLQDAVLPASEMRYERRARRFVALVNRLRHEDLAAARRSGRPPERVQSLLTVRDVLEVASQGITPGNADQILSLLSLSWEPGDEGSGALTLILAGDGAIRLRLETLELQLEDVTRPYIAPSRKVPDHGA
ncbi:DUF2948 family protein [Pseudogemmobacter faecipullorum]|uniref:DUF2948 family protein n=1 Tax=Pseudogemmobacter faecipullorum TaxID=2755041 RepID=A0ABS8CMA9_9RHOB|nr:DUF2948 family protein [Pseudogemmobacter faecipullorum]MCB5410528.1 DUF2948 family protein [Pseudogemmobacter faecipullorum]